MLDDEYEREVLRHTPVGVPVEILPEVAPGVRDLLLGFQSLGCDCEFGLVQRRYQAEPLGLLRWSNGELPVLLRMLGTGFEGLGDPAQTELRVAPWGELLIYDRRYETHNHAFIRADNVDHPRFLAAACRRIQFLRRLLLEELAGGDKIFVFKANSVLAEADIAALQAAIGQYGENRLLVVGKPPEGGAAGFEPREGRLMVARMARLGPQAGEQGSYWDIAFQNWVMLCENAARLL